MNNCEDKADNNLSAFLHLEAKFAEFGECCTTLGKEWEKFNDMLFGNGKNQPQLLADYLIQIGNHIYHEGHHVESFINFNVMTNVYTFQLQLFRGKSSVAMAKFSIVGEYLEHNFQDAFEDSLGYMCQGFKHYGYRWILPSSQKLFLDKGGPDSYRTFEFTENPMEYLEQRQPAFLKAIRHSVKIIAEKIHDLDKAVSPTGTTYSNSGVLLNKICPGLAEMVKWPCGCKELTLIDALEHNVVQSSVQDAIIHLNDSATHEDGRGEWTREEIADWLESLDVDLTLTTQEEKS